MKNETKSRRVTITAKGSFANNASTSTSTSTSTSFTKDKTVSSATVKSAGINASDSFGSGVMTLTEAYLSAFYLHRLIFGDVPLGSASNPFVLTFRSLSTSEFVNASSNALLNGVRDSGADTHRLSAMNYHFGTVLLDILNCVRETLESVKPRLSIKDGIDLKI